MVWKASFKADKEYRRHRRYVRAERKRRRKIMRDECRANVRNITFEEFRRVQGY